MELYFILKIIHVISACILFGTGMGTACYMLLANQTGNLKIISIASGHVVKADWLFTTTSGIVQALTGFAMAYLHGFSVLAPWLLAAIIGYVIAGACWLPVVYFQIQLHKIASDCLASGSKLPRKYYSLYKSWFILGWPAFISLIFVYYFMVAKPAF